MVSGIGGVGKSSLVARFALSLPADTLFLWLDFDRADLAPDDALSVMTLLNQQASVQLADFKGPDLIASVSKIPQHAPVDDKATGTKHTRKAATQLGRELCQSLKGNSSRL